MQNSYIGQIFEIYLFSIGNQINGWCGYVKISKWWFCLLKTDSNYIPGMCVSFCQAGPVIHYLNLSRLLPLLSIQSLSSHYLLHQITHGTRIHASIILICLAIFPEKNSYEIIVRLNWIIDEIEGKFESFAEPFSRKNFFKLLNLTEKEKENPHAKA